MIIFCLINIIWVKYFYNYLYRLKFCICFIKYVYIFFIFRLFFHLCIFYLE
uniref:Uncharacterized protein n=1 Tax=Herposiphonia versicolor TaxID=2007163 RepID=A0A1Z1MGC7_9FLOR|nr:hypothetical protein [Herposiphonia versicolor]ARW64875.1 hypothetical protein [Herposiphonia versicolor]